MPGKEENAHVAAMTAPEREGRDMTLAELAAETLTEKNRRLRQTKCRHADIYWSAVFFSGGGAVNTFCWDCGKHWRTESPPRTPTADRNGG